MKISSPPLYLREDTFLSKVHPPTYATVHVVMLSRRHQRSSTVQEERLTNEGRYHLLLPYKQEYYSLMMLRRTSRLLKIHPPLSLRSHLTFSTFERQTLDNIMATLPTWSSINLEVQMEKAIVGCYPWQPTTTPITSTHPSLC